ncbi:hypothetical protein [Falsiphaeobacter marinintestinus]|uniref:hypothetical protein n=1 Tax=Falsiphaeobacter marinintestinus TaxID=1492905 RepID=UPI0011B4C660|nr:hypothetical protein [Phaeobacter marinintestinus]
MSNENNTNNGLSRHWKLAGVGGVVVAVVYSVLTGAGIGSSVLIGALFTGVAGFVMGRNSEGAAETPAAPQAAAPQAEPVETIVDAVVETVEDVADDVAETVATAAPATQSLIKPSTALPGQAELAERKGSWRYDANNASA